MCFFFALTAVQEEVFVQFELSSYQINEGMQVKLSIVLSSGPASNVSVEFATEDGSAIAGKNGQGSDLDDIRMYAQ